MLENFQDLLQALYQHPEWREELRRLVLTQEILTLLELVRELTEAQKRTEQRVEERPKRKSAPKSAWSSSRPGCTGWRRWRSSCWWT